MTDEVVVEVVDMRATGAPDLRRARLARLLFESVELEAADEAVPA